jgi:acylphosphatase
MQGHTTAHSHSPHVTAASALHAGPATLRRSVYFSGRVQGVGFRYTARNIALQHDVGGFVRNLPDGRVELILEGSEGEIVRTIDELRRKMSAFIRGMSMETSPATGEFDQFGIRY